MACLEPSNLLLCYPPSPLPPQCKPLPQGFVTGVRGILPSVKEILREPSSGSSRSRALGEAGSGEKFGFENLPFLRRGSGNRLSDKRNLQVPQGTRSLLRGSEPPTQLCPLGPTQPPEEDVECSESQSECWRGLVAGQNAGPWLLRQGLEA